TGGSAGSDPDPVEEPLDEQPPLTDDAAADDREEPTEAADLTELIGLLGDNLDAAGEKGEDLLDKLRDLQAEPDSEDARKLMKDVAEWMSKGEIDAGLGEQAVALLEEESRPGAADLADASALLADVATTTAEWADKGKDLHSRLTKLLETEAPGKQAKRSEEHTSEL